VVAAEYPAPGSAMGVGSGVACMSFDGFAFILSFLLRPMFHLEYTPGTKHQEPGTLKKKGSHVRTPASGPQKVRVTFWIDSWGRTFDVRASCGVVLDKHAPR